MPSEHVRHYIDRAVDFLEGMQRTRQEPAFRNSSALLAIHSALSYSDAIRSGLGDEKLANDDHRKAVDGLRKLLAEKRIEDETGFQHLSLLLSKKNVVAYDSRRLTHTDYESLFVKAERFAGWADRIGKKLNIRGWTDEDQ